MKNKLLISNQHGVWVMALLPFFYAMSLSPFVWQSVFLLLGWLSLYLMTYPFLALFKGRNLDLYKKWTLIYGLSTALLLSPALFLEPRLFFFGLAILPFVGVAIYYVKTQNERALMNDLSGITIFSIIASGAYFFTAKTFDLQMLKVFTLPWLFFMATTLYVKTMLRERKNPRYYQASVLVHSLLLAGAFGLYPVLGLSFLPAFLRAIVLPKRKLSTKQVGLTEFGISLSFFIGLLIYG